MLAQSDEWECPICTLQNPNEVLVCDACSEPRQTDFWEVKIEDSWVKFGSDLSATLSQSFTEGKKVIDIDVKGFRYEIDFRSMTQVFLPNNFIKKIN